VGHDPSDASIICLLGAVLLEQNDEWSVQTRYLQVEPMAELAAIDTADPIQVPPLAA
jgi:putative transposase